MLQYRVLPIQEEILTQGFQNLVTPENTAVSPLGWVTTTTTACVLCVCLLDTMTFIVS